MKLPEARFKNYINPPRKLELTKNSSLPLENLREHHIRTVPFVRRTVNVIDKNNLKQQSSNRIASGKLF